MLSYYPEYFRELIYEAGGTTLPAFAFHKHDGELIFLIEN
jgi:hypothetical protein